MDSGDLPRRIIIDNEKIIEFYTNHKNLDIEKVNLKFIEMFENIIPHGVDHLRDTNITDIVSNLCSEIENLKKQNALFITSAFEEIKNDIRGILQTTSSDKITQTIRDYMEMFQDKTKLLVNTDNTSMLKELHSIKTEVSDKMGVIKEITLHNKNEQTELLSDISKLLQKMGGSSDKGKISEQTVSQLLYSLYPSASIQNTTKQKESGDFLLKRQGKYDIMIENKIYSRSVDDQEVMGFLRDGRKNNVCGIMLSQQHGISNKKNYQIDIMDKNVYVYVHQVFHDPNKIKIAVDIIDTLKKELDLILQDKNICMDRDMLDKINKEYNEIIIIRTNQQKLLEDYNKNMNKLIDSIKLPTLGDFLTENGGSIHINHEFKCEFCNRTFPSNTGLNNHKRSCKKQPQINIE
jgi:hypothetical protein